MTQRLHHLDRTPLSPLISEGVSPWLDGFSRAMVAENEFTRLISRFGLRGAHLGCERMIRSLREGDVPREVLRSMATGGVPVGAAIRAVVADTVRDACDILQPVFTRTHGIDGYVSTVPDPRASAEASVLVAEAGALALTVNRPNFMVAFPVGPLTSRAIGDCLGHGIPVHLLGVFSPHRCREVTEAYVEGLERARGNGHRLSGLGCLISVPLDLIDRAVDIALPTAGNGAEELRGRTSLAVARLLYHTVAELLDGERWRDLAASGARPPRISLVVRDPCHLSLTEQVARYIAWGTVQMFSRSALEILERGVRVDGDTLDGRYREAADLLDRLDAEGVRYGDIALDLERKRADSLRVEWQELREEMRAALEGAFPSGGR